MTFLPIADRELRIRARRATTFLLRCLAAAVAFGLTALLLMRGGLWSGGDIVFRVVIGLAFLFCLFEGSRNTADCLSEEKRGGTLGLLFLTDLKGYDVVIGKLLATSLSSFYGLVAILPAIGVPLLTGGVTAGEFWRAVLVLIVTLFFSLSVGMFVSSVSWSERRAWAATGGIIIFFTALPPLLNEVSFSGLSFLNWASPTMALFSIHDEDYKAQPRTFWTAVAGTHALSLVLLATTAAILPKVLQVRNVPVLRNRGMNRLRSENPVAWFVSEQEGQRVFVWLFVLASAGVLLTMAFFTKSTLTTLAVTALVTHFVLTGWVAFHACHNFHDAKTSGVLEQLVPTPLSSREILDGFVAALKRIFEVPVLSLLVVEGLIIMGKSKDIGSAVGLLVFAIIAWYFLSELHAVAFYGMWTALRVRRPNQAFTKTMLIAVIIPMGLSLFCCFGVLYPIIAIVKNRVIVNSYEWPLYKDFRKLITEA